MLVVFPDGDPIVSVRTALKKPVFSPPLTTVPNRHNNPGARKFVADGFLGTIREMPTSKMEQKTVTEATSKVW